jgi:hypothetical protein
MKNKKELAKIYQRIWAIGFNGKMILYLANPKNAPLI